MDLADAMNSLLADNCPNPSNVGPEWGEYSFELHCLTATVIAKPLGDCKYEIHSIKYSD